MKRIKVEFDKKQNDFVMPSPHTHDQYELYFLLEGTRSILLKNYAFTVPKYSLCVFPPFSLHKTAGGPHSKISAYIPTNLLSENEISFLNKCVSLLAVKLDGQSLDCCLELLKALSTINSDALHNEQYDLALTKSLLFFLQQQDLQSALEISPLNSEPQFDSLILDIVQYLETHYAEKITLNEVCNHFFLSKATLCRRFKSRMNCSVWDYLLNLRISKAKQLLFSSTQSIESISESCGFSSANYFGMVFKQLVGKSPLNYRNHPN